MIPSGVVTWTTSDRFVANVNSSGRVTAGRAGTATIKGTIDGIEGMATVTVVPGVVAGIVILGAPSEIMVGDAVQLQATLVDARDRFLAPRPVTWASTHPAVASVGADGMVTGLSAGTASITAELDGVVAQVTLDVRRAPGLGVVVGGNHACYLTSGGEAWCWGKNDKGQLGIGTTTNSATPVHGAPDLLFKSIALGENHTCGVTLDGEIYCWGDGANQKLGIVVSQSSTPLLVSAGPWEFVGAYWGGTCTANAAGALHCWGQNSNDHEMGSPGTSASGTPTACSMPVDGNAFEVVAHNGGRFTNCALTADSHLYCWGWNLYGQVGNGNTTSQAVPISPFPSRTVEAFALGEYHTCAISEGVTYCWGQNTYGQLGNGSTSNSVAHQLVSTNGVQFVALAGGYQHFCALDDAGAAWCWGRNNKGQLGRSGGDSSVPVRVAGDLVFAKLSTRYEHTCGEDVMGTLYCWGANDLGQLGTGQTGGFIATPTAVAAQW